VLLISLGLFVVRVASGHLTFLRRWTANVDDAPLTQEQIARPRAIEQLFRGDGKHLVLVRYSPDHDLDEEWVYNDASIDAARIVWAREMDIAENKQLIEYFKDRKTWLLEVDENPPRLTPYLSSSQRQPAENSPK
jgi:hypothetical protein